MFALNPISTLLNIWMTSTVITYLAYSIAPADQGLVNSIDGFGAAGVPTWRDEGACGSLRSVGERNGEEKDRR